MKDILMYFFNSLAWAEILYSKMKMDTKKSKILIILTLSRRYFFKEEILVCIFHIP